MASIIEAGKPVKIPAFGRPFDIGTLYDLRSEELIPGLKLWDQEFLHEIPANATVKPEDVRNGKTTVKCQSGTVTSDIKVFTENSINDKWYNLDLSAELKLNLMSGMIDIKGSASYLKNTKTYDTRSRVRMEYSATTSYKELTMEAIKNIQHEDVMMEADKSKLWTHVVVAIQYGASCNIIFETETSDSQEKQNVAGSLAVELKNIPISGKADLKLDNIDKEIKDKTTCEIHSDIKVDTNARTFEECMKIYKEIPAKVNADGFEGVPVTVWLMPMKIFKSENINLVYELKQELINAPKQILECLDENINKVFNAKLQVVRFPVIEMKLNRYHQCLSTYRQIFSKDILKVLLPKIKSNGNTEELSEAIAQNEISPFVKNKIERLSSSLEKEKNILTTIERNVLSKNSTFVDNIDESAFNELCVAFTFHLSSRKSPMLDVMESFQQLVSKGATKDDLANLDQEIFKTYESWVDDLHLREEIRLRGYAFKQFVDVNKEFIKDNVKFVIHGLECQGEEKPQVYIQVYKEGAKKKDDDDDDDDDLGAKTHSSFVPPTDVKILSTEVTHDTITLKWKEPSKGSENVDCYEITYVETKKLKIVKDENNAEVIPPKVIKTNQSVTSFCLENLEPNTSYDITIQPVCLKLLRGKSTDKFSVCTNPSTPPGNLTYEISNLKIVKLNWIQPTIIAEGLALKSYEVRIKENIQNWRSMLEKINNSEVVVNDLKCGTGYEVQIRASFGSGIFSDFSPSLLFTTQGLKPPQNLLLKSIKSDYVLLWVLEDVRSEDEVSFAAQYKHVNDNEWIDLDIPTNKVVMSLSGKRKCILDVDLSTSGKYLFRLNVTIGDGGSGWSDPCSYFYNEDGDGDGDDDDDDDEDDDDDDAELEEKFFNQKCIITKADIRRCVAKFGFIVEKGITSIENTVSSDSYRIPASKEKALLRFTERITSVDYKIRSKPLQWLGNEEKTEESAVLKNILTGIYHPMDLLFDIIRSLDLSQRKDFYNKLTFCKLAVPVIYKDLTFCDVSLRDVEIQWKSKGTVREGNALEADIPLISTVRVGTLGISKSAFCNDLLGYHLDAATGSCGFYDRRGIESTGERVDANGVVEGTWFQNVGGQGVFAKSCSLLNLRGDALDNMELSKNVVKSSDITLFFVGDLREEEKNNFHLLLEEIQKDASKNISHVAIMSTKKLSNETKSCVKKIIKKSVFKILKENNNALLTDIRGRIDEWMDTIIDAKTLKDRFVSEGESLNYESDVVTSINAVADTSRDITDMMVEIESAASAADRKLKRSTFITLQTMVRECSEAKREQNRATDDDISKTNETLVNQVLLRQYEAIKNGLPKLTSGIINSLGDISEQDAYVRIRHYQEVLDEWCKKNLPEKRANYISTVKVLEEMKEEVDETKVDKDQIKVFKERCEDLNDQIVTLSIGIENIMREMGQIYEIVKAHLADQNLNPELRKCFERLPSLVAEMLMRGLALEIMDGDGLSVPIDWLKKVLKEANEVLKRKLSMRTDPKVFVVTVLGTQSTGKSTLLNCMFGVKFTVGAGRCTRGAFLQLIPTEIDDFPYDAILVIDTEGLSAPEFRGNVTHDNEIATYVLGISDLAIINIRGELPTNIENFLEISTCAFMRMNLAQKKRSCVFVHQNCDPSSKDKNLDSRRKFIEQMDTIVQIQATLMKQGERFKRFYDLIQVSIEKDFFYFPGLFEGSPPMSPPNWDYSYHCAKLKDYILQKMVDEKVDKTLMDFSKNTDQVWNSVLQENFVFSLRNSTELQVRYDMEKLQTEWRQEMASSISKTADRYCNLLKAKSADELEKGYEGYRTDIESDAEEKAKEQKSQLANYISGKIENKDIYKDWQGRTESKIDGYLEKYKGGALANLKKLYLSLSRTQDWTNSVNDMKAKLYQKVRERAEYLLKVHKEITQALIDKEFEKFWADYKKELQKKDKETIYKEEDVEKVFQSTLRETFISLQKFQEVKSHYRSLSINKKFDIKWVENNYINRTGWWDDVRSKFYVTEKEKVKLLDLITSTKQHMKDEYLKLIETNGVRSLKMQTKETFNCKELVSQYVDASRNIITAKHIEKGYDKDFELGEPFIPLACFEMSRYDAIEAFKEAQSSFLNSTKFENNISKFKSELFKLFDQLMKNESAVNICNTSISNIIMTKALEVACSESYGRGADESIPSIIIKNHFDRKNTVHGLVLLDILHALKETPVVNKEMIKKYMQNPIGVLEDKIRFMIDKRFPEKRNVLEILMKKKIQELTKKLKEYATFEGILIAYVEKHDNIKAFDALLEDGNVEKFIKANLPLWNEILPENKIQELTKKLKEHASIKSKLIAYVEKHDDIKALGIGPNDLANIIEPSDEKRKLKDKVEYLTALLKDENVEKFIKANLPLLDEIAKPDYSQSMLIQATAEKLKAIVNESIDTIRDDLFSCQACCPFCKALCDRDCGKKGTDLHHAITHRPKGIAGLGWTHSDQFSEQNCQESIKNGTIYVSGGKRTNYKDYKTLGEPFSLWNISATTSGEDLNYWKFVSYKVNQDIQYYHSHLKSSKAIDDWNDDYITFDKAKDVILRTYRLEDDSEIKCTEEGVYYRDTKK